MVKTWSMIYLKNAEYLVEDERSKFHSLSVDDSVQIIVEDWSWKDKLSRGERGGFHLLLIAKIV